MSVRKFRQVFFRLRAAAAAACLVGLAGFASADMSKDSVNVGVISAFSGPDAAAGLDWHDGVKLAVRQINASGGILGKPVELVLYDTESSPQLARLAAREAARDDVFVILGPDNHSAGVLAMPEAEANAIPQFTAPPVNGLALAGKEFIFANDTSIWNGLYNLGTYLEDHLTTGRVGVVWTNDLEHLMGQMYFRDLAQALDLTIVSEHVISQSEAALAGTMRIIEQQAPEAIVVFASAGNSVRLLNAANEAGVNTVFYGGSVLGSHEVISSAAAAANGVISHMDYAMDQANLALRTVMQDFVSAYDHMPSESAIRGYSTTYVVKYVTEQIKRLDRDMFAEAMHGLCISPFDMPQIINETCWDDLGNMARASFIVEVQDERQVLVRSVPPLH